MALLDEVRDLANEPDDSNGFTDVKLIAIIDEKGQDVNLAVSEVWTQKAGKLADLVDTSEAGSSRKLGDLYKQALAMAAHYAGLSATIISTNERVTRIRSITRA